MFKPNVLPRVQVLSQSERDEERRREMERVKEEMRQFRDKQKETAKLGSSGGGRGRPDFATDSGYLFYPYVEGGAVVPQKPRIVLVDLALNNNSLASEERDSLGKLLQQLGAAVVKPEEKKEVAAAEQQPAAPPPLSPEDEEELGRSWTLLSLPDISEAEETELFKGLIAQQRVDLIKGLVGRVAPIREMGRSRLFAALCQRYVGERKYKDEEKAAVEENVVVENTAPVNGRRASQDSEVAKPPSRRESQESKSGEGSKSRHSSGGGAERSRSRHASGADKASRSEKERSRHPTGESTGKEQPRLSVKDDKKAKSRHSTGEKMELASDEKEASDRLRHSTDELPPTSKGKPEENGMLEEDRTGPTTERRSSDSDKENRESAEAVKAAPSLISAAIKRPSTAEKPAAVESKRPKLEPSSTEERPCPNQLTKTTIVMNADLPLAEVKQGLGLVHLDVCVRLKNLRKVYRAHMARLSRRLNSDVTSTSATVGASTPSGITTSANPAEALVNEKSSPNSICVTDKDVTNPTSS